MSTENNERTNGEGEIKYSGINSIMRNKNRVLKHLGLARKKLAIMKKLGFCAQSPFWLQNRQFLIDVKSGNIDIGAVLGVIGKQTGMPLQSIREELLSAYETGLVEFHATDICDLHCIDCHYRQKDNATMPFDRIAEYFTALNPKCATITGGGEPGCYSSQGKTLNDLVHMLHSQFPSIQLGLINNNTSIPDGDWYNCLAWQRSSVDAAEEETYAAIKRRDKYNACVKNVYTFLQSDIPFVGIGFLYRAENISGMKAFLLDWYGRWLEMGESEKAKFNIQLRPISPAIDNVAAYDARNKLERETAEALGSIRRYALENDDFSLFLRNVTNFDAITPNGGSYYLHTALPFSKCYNALLHRVLRSDGSEYPDFLLCNDASMSLGNVLTAENPEDERIKIALGTFYFHHCLPERYCAPETCRQCWVSNLVEAHLDSEAPLPGLPDSWFF